MGEHEGGRVIVSTTISLDGYSTGPDEDMGFVFNAGMGPSPLVDRLIARTGAFLSGRGSYEYGRRHNQEAFDGTWTGAQFILTHKPPEPPDPAVTFLSGDIRTAVATARAAAGPKDLNVAGANVVQQCVAAGLVDELVLFVVPVLLGGGIRLFDRFDGGETALELLECAAPNGVVNLHYRVRG
jgi:dihydrofolate reductase